MAKIRATEADFEIELHQPQWLKLGDSVTVCGVCGRFPNGVYWGKAPGQPRLSPDAEAMYRAEQAS